MPLAAAVDKAPTKLPTKLPIRHPCVAAIPACAVPALLASEVPLHLQHLAGGCPGHPGSPKQQPGHHLPAGLQHCGCPRPPAAVADGLLSTPPARLCNHPAWAVASAIARWVAAAPCPSRSGTVFCPWWHSVCTAVWCPLPQSIQQPASLVWPRRTACQGALLVIQASDKRSRPAGCMAAQHLCSPRVSTLSAAQEQQQQHTGQPQAPNAEATPEERRRAQLDGHMRK